MMEAMRLTATSDCQIVPKANSNARVGWVVQEGVAFLNVLDVMETTTVATGRTKRIVQRNP